MKHRIVSGLVLVPLMIVLSTTPAYAIFGSIIAAIQRAQMIVNQGVQIYNDAMEKITMNGQLTELTDQFSHLKEQALGTVGALTQPFTDLSSVPTEFIGVGLSWKNDFTGVAGELAGAVEQLGESGTSFTDAWNARLTASNTISESDFLSLYAAQSPEVGAAASRLYLAAAEAGDKKLVMAHAQSDAAKNLMVAAKEAVSSWRCRTAKQHEHEQHRATASDGCRDRDPGQPYRCDGAVDGLSGVPGERERVRTGDSTARRTGSFRGGRARSADCF